MKAPIKIYLNGTEITGRIDGLDSFEITISQDTDDGVVSKSFSSELVFYDDGYAILRSQLIDAFQPLINDVVVDIYDECCATKIFEGVIRADAIDWCEPICAITANIIQRDPAYDCIQSTVIWDDQNGFLSRPRVKLRYSTAMRPEAIFYVMVFIYAILNAIIYLVLIPLFAVLSLIALLALQNPVEVWDDLTGWMDEMNDRLIITNWYHPTAFVRDYIQNVCDICGLEFKSSILNESNSYYYDTMLFSAQVRKGYKPSQTISTLLEQNLPVETVETLMKSHLMPLFNARYWILNGQLIFERKDYFDNSVNNDWIDFSQLYNDGLVIDNRICYSYRDEQLYAFATYQYALDAIEIGSNEAKHRFDNIIEWNDPPFPSQKGELTKAFLSSQARFVGDQIENDPYTTFLFKFLPVTVLFGDSFQDAQGTMYLADHTATNYKFLIWDRERGMEDGRVRSLYFDYDIFVNTPPPGTYYYNDIKIDDETGNIVPFPIPQGDRFNYPFTFYNENDNINNLYTDFHFIDNPRRLNYKRYDFSFTFNFSCAQLASFDISKQVRLFLNGQLKRGEIKEIKVNFLNRTIAVSGIV
jgi:hypothetical protein